MVLLVRQELESPLHVPEPLLSLHLLSDGVPPDHQPLGLLQDALRQLEVTAAEAAELARPLSLLLLGSVWMKNCLLPPESFGEKKEVVGSKK